MNTFNAKKHLIKMSGKEYLETKWRIAWMRAEHPNWRIGTEVVSFDPVVMKATIADESGQVIATGHGGATDKGNNVWSGHNIEKAETAAIGRALGHAGYGTQFATSATETADSLNHPVDNPVNASQQNGKKHETVFNKSSTSSRVRDWQGIFKAVERFYDEDTEEKRKGHWWNGTVKKLQKVGVLTDDMTDKAVVELITAYKGEVVNKVHWWQYPRVKQFVNAELAPTGMNIVGAEAALGHGASEYKTPALFVEAVKGMVKLDEFSSKVTV